MLMLQDAEHVGLAGVCREDKGHQERGFWLGLLMVLWSSRLQLAADWWCRSLLSDFVQECTKQRHVCCDVCKICRKGGVYILGHSFATGRWTTRQVYRMEIFTVRGGALLAQLVLALELPVRSNDALGCDGVRSLVQEAWFSSAYLAPAKRSCHGQTGCVCRPCLVYCCFEMLLTLQTLPFGTKDTAIKWLVVPT